MTGGLPGWIRVGYHLAPDVAGLAGLALLLVLAVYARPVWRHHRQELALALGLCVGAFVLRAFVPWGTLNFAEPERLELLWKLGGNPHARHPAAMAWMLFARELPGATPGLVFHWTGVIFGALGVGAVFGMVRAWGGSRTGALLAGLALLLWPTHLRFSGAMTFALFAGLFLTLAITLVRAPRPDWARPLGVAAAMILAVGMRLEAVLLLPVLFAMTFGTGPARWRWRERIALVVLSTPAALVPFLEVLHPSEGSVGVDANRLDQALRPLFDPATSPSWWVVLGLVGLLLGAGALRIRAAVLAGTLVLFAIHLTHGGVAHIGRYDLPLLPLLLFGVAAGFDRVVTRWPSRYRLAVGLLGLGLVGGLFQLPLAFRPVDSQVEFHFIVETAREVMADDATVFVLTDETGPHAGSWYPQRIPALPLAVAMGEPVDEKDVCTAPPKKGVTSVRTLQLGDPACLAAAARPRSFVFLGLFRPDDAVARLRAAGLTSVMERRVEAAPQTHLLNTDCALEDGRYIGAAIPDCPVTLGWYRLE